MMTPNMTPEELYRFTIYERIQQAKVEAGHMMKRIVEINAMIPENDTDEKINSELLHFATELLKTYNDRTTRLLWIWAKLNP